MTIYPSSPSGHDLLQVHSSASKSACPLPKQTESLLSCVYLALVGLCCVDAHHHLSPCGNAGLLLISLHFHFIFACLEWPCPSSLGERYLLWREPLLSFLVRSCPSFVSPGDGPCEHPQRGKQSDRRSGLRWLGLPDREKLGRAGSNNSRRRRQQTATTARQQRKATTGDSLRRQQQTATQ